MPTRCNRGFYCRSYCLLHILTTMHGQNHIKFGYRLFNKLISVHTVHTQIHLTHIRNVTHGCSICLFLPQNVKRLFTLLFPQLVTTHVTIAVPKTGTTTRVPKQRSATADVVNSVCNMMAHAQKPDLVFRRNGRVHLNRRGASVQSTAGSRGVHISGSNAGYTMFRGSVKSTGYPLHSPVSPSFPHPYDTMCHHISTGLYTMMLRTGAWR